MNKLYLMIVGMIGANLIYPPAKANTVYLPETKFNEKVDRAHAECANIDLDFSNKFRSCLNMKAVLFAKLVEYLEGSSTVFPECKEWTYYDCTSSRFLY